MKNKFEEFYTPHWAFILVTGKINKFTDAQLRVMKIFVDDELKARAEKAKEVAL